MKKLISIGFLALLLFNMAGFSVYSLLENYNNSNSADRSTVLLKVPFSLPYVSEWEGNVNPGNEFLHQDDYYQVVSHKVANDTLYLQGEFTETARDRFWGLVSSFDDHIKTSNENSKNLPGHVVKQLFKEYMSSGKRVTFFILHWTDVPAYPEEGYSLLSGTKSIFSPPPNLG